MSKMAKKQCPSGTRKVCKKWTGGRGKYKKGKKCAKWVCRRK